MAAASDGLPMSRTQPTPTRPAAQPLLQQHTRAPAPQHPSAAPQGSRLALRPSGVPHLRITSSLSASADPGEMVGMTSALCTTVVCGWVGVSVCVCVCGGGG
jgi:hypothetical protein